MFRAEFHSSIAQVPAESWNGIFRSDNPFIRHGFLLALEQSQSVCAETGWTPRHLVLYQDAQAVAAMPLYLKSHSYGEFVFDWGWAQAYERFGLDYYPKLTAAIPFTPSTGPRLGVLPGIDREAVLARVCDVLALETAEQRASGWHFLFPELQTKDATILQEHGLLGRQDIQFHWFNHGYSSFDDYLAVLRSSRRKNLKRERRVVESQGVQLERLVGGEITSGAWSHFYHCYCNTYMKRSGHSGYLNRDFFDLLLEQQSDSMLLVIAHIDDEVVASSLFFHDSQRLYGRYWGALRQVEYLHFEACFYQGIEFCIERGLKEFDPGTQGEHKLLRGFEPVRTDSFHWIADERFRDAIARFLSDEKMATQEYGEQAAQLLPFKSGGR